jgi:hypothetical protein
LTRTSKGRGLRNTASDWKRGLMYSTVISTRTCVRSR